MRKTFVYDASDITRQNDTTRQLYKKIIRRLNIAHKEATIIKAQKVVTIIYVRFKVTICLYLSPNIRARNLSTLMAVIVIKDTEYNTEPVM